MEEMVGCAVETLFKDNAGGRKSIWMPLLKSLLLKRILPLKRLNAIHTALDSLPEHGPIPDRILEVLGITFDISKADQTRIPASGPLVVVANHPFGAIEGLILASILMRARDDVKIMANFLLGVLGIEKLNEILLYVDPLERKASTVNNLKPLREAIQWVRDGRALGLFPAGEVSHVHLDGLGVIDRQWSRTVARIIKRTEATVLPVYFEGRNSLLFCGLGLLHPLLRTIMLPRENLAKGSRTFGVHVGKPVPFRRMAGLDDAAMMDYLRLRTYNLKNRSSKRRLRLLPASHGPASAANRQPVARARAAGSISREIRNLPSEQLLVSAKDFDVVSAIAPQIPDTLHEIGRLREIAFRKAGEGTGRAIDIDRFDSYYRHIILWNREREEVAGAYRLGLAPEILEESGPAGLYTSTLFEFKNELFPRISPAIEVGRSFVCPEYQKTYQPLLLLWSGIGRFVSRNPQYRFLFGAVSISNEYLGISRRLIVRCLKEGYTCPDLARFVRPRHPAARWPAIKKGPPLAHPMVCDINEVSEIVSDIEKDAKGIPILLKHYMKLGGQFLGFGQDPKFSNSIDALVLVDLVRTDPKILERYMGRQGMEAFLEFHCPGAAERDDKCA